MPSGCLVSVGQASELPVHVSAASHVSDAARQTVVLAAFGLFTLVYQIKERSLISATTTAVTVRWAAINATEAERKTFEAGQDSMQQGWSGTFEQLTAYLAKEKA